MLKAELSRFKVKEGKSGKVDEWMAFLNEHIVVVKHFCNTYG